MSRLREAPDKAQQLLDAITRELARVRKRRTVYHAAGRFGIAGTLERRMRTLARLRDETALQVNPTARIVDDADADDAATDRVLPPNALVYPIEAASDRVSSPNGPAPRRALSTIEFPAMTADLVEDDPLDGLV